MIALANRLKTKWYWAKSNPLFWYNIALVIGTLAVIKTYPAPIIESVPSDFRIKTWGMLLQLLGVFTVWHDLASAGQTFGKAGIFSRNWTWIKAGFGRPHLIACAGSSQCNISGGKARATQRRNPPPDATIEERVEALEYNRMKMDEDISSVFKEVDQTETNLKAKIAEESQNRKASINVLDERLKEAIVGNYSVLAFGVVWLIVGMTISTFAPEIARIIAGQWSLVLKSM